MIIINTDFAKNAIEYIQTRDESILRQMCQFPSTEHLFYHACNFNLNHDINCNNHYDFVKGILKDVDLRENVSKYKTIIGDLERYIGLENEVEEETKRYLPRDTHISTNMYITLGYFCVGIGGNFNINL